MQKWKCSVCGFIHEGDDAPEVCPICDARKEEFELIEESRVELVSKEVRSIVIIGNGAAGIEAARSARRLLDDAEIHIYAQEPHSFYSRLYLTPYLAGEKNREELFVFPQDWYKKNNIIQHLDEPVNEIIPAEQEILTANDVRHYDRLILCNGSQAFRPYLAGEEKKGVFTLRNLHDADKILKYLTSVKKAIVVGGGILGLEAAGALAKHGIAVEVLEIAETVMPRQLDKTAAKFMTGILAERGISVKTNAEIRKIFDTDRFTGIGLKDGCELAADLLLISIGIRPNLTLADVAGLKVNKGIVVNDYLQTSDPNIYAAGDVAEHRNRIYGLWYASVDQGKIAGQNAAGAEIVYAGTVPSVVLKVIGIDLTSLGQIEKVQHDDEEIIYLPKRGYDYKKLVIRNNQVIGAIVFANNRLSSAIQLIMKKKKPLSSDILSAVRDGSWELLIDASRRKR